MTNDSKTNERRSSLPVLPQVNINSPCPMNWETMEGDSARRFCGSCQKHVHNFEELHSDEVNTLLESGNSVCAKILRLPDGTIITKDTPRAREQSMSRRKWFSRFGTLAASLLAIMTIGGCKEPVEQVMGDVAAPPAVEAPVLLGEVCVGEEMGGASFASQPVVKQPTEPVKLLGRVGPKEPNSK